MKPKLVTALLASGVFLAVSSNSASAQTVLFADNYDRPDSDDVDASTVGMSGTLGPQTYLEVWQGGSPGTDNRLRVAGNMFQKQNAGLGSGGINHNFTDAAILSSGGFSLSYDVGSFNNAPDDIPDRWAGFGVGLTLAEIMAFQDDNDFNTGPRGAIAGTIRPGVADFFVGLSQTTNIQVFAGGSLVGEFPVLALGSKTVKTEFSFSDFNAGSTVNYSVLFEGNAVTSGTFNWSNTGENYVGFSFRAPTTRVDNLEIATLSVPEPSIAVIGMVGVGIAGLVIGRRKR